MPVYGDDPNDLFTYKQFYTGDHLLPTTPQPNTTADFIANWQAFDRAWRVIAGIPHDTLGASYGTRYELRFGYRYVIGDKYRVLVRDNTHERSVQLPVPPGGIDRQADYAAAYGVGVVDLDNT